MPKNLSISKQFSSHLVKNKKNIFFWSVVLKRVKVILKMDTFFWLKIDKSFDKKCSDIPLVLGFGGFETKF